MALTTPKFRRGDRVYKPKGSSWYGTVVGEYSTKLTPEGYAVESAEHPGSVQIYPAVALEAAAKEHGSFCPRCKKAIVHPDDKGYATWENISCPNCGVMFS